MTAVLAGCGTDVTGPASSLMSCVFGPITAEVGEVVQVRGAEHQTVCLASDGSTQYVYIPFFGTRDTASDLSIGVTGTGLANAIDVSGVADRVALETAVGAALPSRPGSEPDFHSRLRAREIRELEPLIRPGGAPLPATLQVPGVAADVPAVGDLRDFNVDVTCSGTDVQTGRVVAVSDHAIIYADTANPADLNAADYEGFGLTFDTLIHPVETTHFGNPTDIDENGRAILFFTRAVNEMNPPDPADDEPVTIGFFWSGDLFPVTETERLAACPASNRSEMFYLIAPDPDGVISFAITLDALRNIAIPLIGHEFQHLINASRRLYVNQATTFEEPWLNEGLSHVAEELLYFEVSGLRAGTNLTVQDIVNANPPADTLFFRYMGGNISNFAEYLSQPAEASLMGPPNVLETRGAIWNFLRYASDRSPVSDTVFFFDLVNGTEGGIANLDRVLGQGESLSWMRDWTVAVYADDLVPGVDARFQASTWNLRDIYPALTIRGIELNDYPLNVRPLADAQTISLDLLAGGTSYMQFGLVADGRGILHVEADGGAPPSALRGSFLRVQ